MKLIYDKLKVTLGMACIFNYTNPKPAIMLVVAR